MRRSSRRASPTERARSHLDGAGGGEAFDLLRQSVRVDPSNPNAWKTLAESILKIARLGWGQRPLAINFVFDDTAGFKRDIDLAVGGLTRLGIHPDLVGELNGIEP